MSIREVADNLFFFRRGALSGNHLAYRDREGGAILIDTGYIAHTGETLRLLRSIGIRPERVRRIVNTHCHCDHVGANRAIQGLSGCDVCLSRPGKQSMDNCDDMAPWWRYFNQEAAFFSAGETMDEAGTVTIGPHVFQVLRTPGHSADSVSLYLAREKLLISGDSLWERDVAVINERLEGRSATYLLMESLDRFAKLSVNTVCPGHGRLFTDAAAAVTRSKRILDGFIADRRQLALDLLRKLFVFTLLMRGALPEEAFALELQRSLWFEETVRSALDIEPEEARRRVIRELREKGVLHCRDGLIWTTVRP